MARLGVREKDLVMICCPTVVRIKLKTKQVLSPNLSTWTMYCLERDPQPSVTFFRLEDQEFRQEVEVKMNTLHDQQLLDESHLVQELNNPRRQFVGQRNHPEQNAVPTQESEATSQEASVLQHVLLNIHKARYNLFSVLSEVVETPRKKEV